MTDDSQRDEMSAAIRAQRERGNVPKSMLPPEDERAPVAPPPPLRPAQKSLLARLLGR